ncbi:ead/Ea22-like family protein [Klebsiella pneumoniae]|uniref:ead/Ea22-like family protein n=1 Tax=Klebsiella pneumoniae TaxID=573 RepID=UPI00237624DB|nr:ead/Ea22-like family protein [Klebsiella pneumoniae]HBQ5947807.1 ead/Ea22-like family protein [Klebsiella pneumoniae subsp. pneumoniae]HBQ5961693.1 ead/Ea22-like family protein [Klebsiella pneumoniae subsp. pneumoniae]HBW1397596.1 hypothetical protein [Klebsiella pneumoniae]HBY7977438.1 hypothetical protein [Klebsiella pneumoniae]
MSDITELAQSLKAAAIDAKELAIIARYSKGRAAAEKFYALANPNNVIALVEALEKAQQRISRLESRTVTVKLPDINEYLAEVHDKTLNRAFRLLAEGVRAGDVAAMRAAGIKVEAE